MCDPPLRTLKSGKLESYPAEVNGLSRQGLFAQVRFRAQGDGSRGALVDPRKSKLFGGGSELRVQKLDMTKDERGDDGKPGIVEGTLEFHLDSRVSTNGEYLLEYGGLGAYRPKLRLNMQRKATTFQRQVSKFLGGYLAKEWETAADRPGGEAEAFEMERIENGLQLPEVPQQERANDCGFFVLEQILQVLQLAPEALRALAQASPEEVAELPWPSQRQVTRRKSKLRDGLGELFKAAREEGTGDVEVLIKKNAELRRLIQSALWDGPDFSEAVGRWVESKRPKFTVEDLEKMPSKELRSLCIQYGVLPSGSLERSSMMEALKPKATAPPPPQPPPNGDGATNTHGGQADFLAGAPFSKEDLDSMPSRTLKTLCIQRGVLPHGMAERTDLVEALQKFATKASTSKTSSPTRCSDPPQVPACRHKL